ncbi:hypothetical protein KM1_315580 [Entamoeba histolytica HM-3:IMSS]|nr:hypothetical protein KM1_315580 [Entamoeba histolytica HM-3:IMSS]GAT94286.1 hypothetical protein CL6EHI_124550 [Entamoeba histolytica]
MSKVDSDHFSQTQMKDGYKTKRYSIGIKCPSSLNPEWEDISHTIQQRVQKLNKKFHKDIKIELVQPSQVDHIIEQSESEEVIIENNSNERRTTRRERRRKRKTRKVQLQANQEPRVNHTHQRIITIRNRQELEAYLLSIIYIIFVCCVSLLIAFVIIIILI